MVVFTAEADIEEIPLAYTPSIPLQIVKKIKLGSVSLHGAIALLRLIHLKFHFLGDDRRSLLLPVPPEGP